MITSQHGDSNDDGVNELKQIIKQFGGNWFTVVMGLGILAALTYTSPVSFPFQQEIGIAFFVILNIVFLVATVLWLLRWVFHSKDAINDFRHPAQALFYGALAMAINIVGNDYFLIGQFIISPDIALTVSKAVWMIGSIVSMGTAIVIPYLLFVNHEVSPGDVLASWLIPVVPPIVAAATGVNLISQWNSQEAQVTVTALIIAMFGITFFLFIMISSMVYSRLVFHKRIPGGLSPSLWVEIGPIGMSMSLFCTLPSKTSVIFEPYVNTLHIVGLLFGVMMWGIGVWWIIISLLHTLLHLGKRGEGIPFTLGWWSYVFPLGSFTNGTYALANLTHLSFFVYTGFVQFILLFISFAIVSSRTLMGIKNGTLIQWKKMKHPMVDGMLKKI